MDKITVEDVWNVFVLSHMQLRQRKYPVVVVLNPGDGPDEKLLAVTAVTWDHDLGVLRIEAEHE